MKVIICDEQQYWINLLVRMIDKWGRERNTSIEYLRYTDLDELRAYFRSDSTADILFLDIEFEGKMEGLAFSHDLHNSNINIPIVFISCRADMASEGYLVDAVGFLIKPFEYETLVLCIDKAIANRQTEEKAKALTIENARVIRHVPHDDIIYVESLAHDLIVHTDEDAHRIRGTLSEILDRLGREGFIQVHRSFVVSVRRIIHIKPNYPYALVLHRKEGNIKLSIGRTFYSQVLSAYIDSIT